MPGSWLNHDSRPLSDQWHELQRRGAVGLVPITQENLFRMRQEVSEIEARQAPRDEALIAAKKEFTAVVHTYRRIWNEITEAQKQLGRHRMDPVYTLIFDMQAALQPVTPPQDVLDAEYGRRKGSEDLYRLFVPEFASVQEYSRALSRMNDLVFALTAKQAAVAAVSRWHATEPDSRIHQIAAALIKRVDTIERATVRHLNAFSERLDNIEQQITRVSKSAKVVRRHWQKAKKEKSK
jgi:hypothetical protein